MLSFLLAHCLHCFTAFSKDAISCKCFLFSILEKLSFLILFSHQLEKSPLCTSIDLRLSTSTWSIHASNKSLSCDTSIKPFFLRKYSFTDSLASWSRWSVGSSTSRKSFSPEKRSASNTFVRSPWLKELNGRYKTSAETFNLSSSHITRHCSHPGFKSSIKSVAHILSIFPSILYGK